MFPNAHQQACDSGDIGSRHFPVRYFVDYRPCDDDQPLVLRTFDMGQAQIFFALVYAQRSCHH
jgi:hypothetical protein